jgi:hypothetical protein
VTRNGIGRSSFHFSHSQMPQGLLVIDEELFSRYESDWLTPTSAVTVTLTGCI